MHGTALQVLWDAGMVGSLKADVITITAMDKQLLLMAFPQARSDSVWNGVKQNRPLMFPQTSKPDSSQINISLGIAGLLKLKLFPD